MNVGLADVETGVHSLTQVAEPSNEESDRVRDDGGRRRGNTERRPHVDCSDRQPPDDLGQALLDFDP